MTDPRSTRAWRKLRDKVVAEEPSCTLRLPGCTGWSRTADHILTYATHPELAMERSNLRGACLHCNQKRGNARSEPAPAATRWRL